ncbi:hypothetical protein T265_06671 [Opisthorchis viverrini]|uniref:Uncharacterized protein n=1 Tax=Opisthorchis viverrini TaxID=6198 RepID=A0A075ADC2_OPIVI|nr:hypothetical protein T265_06671 [Opisthorchis viverrini]KER25974.1 hypothetical protein T265_06671 [Opisthorchis viverrini]
MTELNNLVVCDFHGTQSCCQNLGLSKFWSCYLRDRDDENVDDERTLVSISLIAWIRRKVYTVEIPSNIAGCDPAF